jgi:hypothetical protein
VYKLLKAPASAGAFFMGPDDIGVNLAVQDAVATANLLAEKLARGCPSSEDDLGAVRVRRSIF